MEKEIKKRINKICKLCSGSMDGYSDIFRKRPDVVVCSKLNLPLSLAVVSADCPLESVPTGTRLEIISSILLNLGL